MAYDPFSATDGIFASTLTSPDQMTAIANSAVSSGLNFYKSKNYTRAAAEFKRAIALDPSSTDSYKYLANVYLAQKKNDDAIKVYKNALALDPSQDEIHTNLGNIYLQKKDYPTAEKEFKSAIKLNPTSPLAPYMLGQMYQQNGRYADAERQFKQVIRMSPTDPNPFYALGATYNKEGKYSDAVKELTQAIKLRPKMAAAHMELGVAYAALGDTANAQKEVGILAKLDAAQGALLKASIKQPKIIATSSNDFYTTLGPNTQLYAVAPALIQPDTSKEFSMTFYFDSKMDPKSVQDPQNWTISKATGGAAGYYNNMMISPYAAYIPQNPVNVSYDPDKQSATITFLLSQNSNTDPTKMAVIDPSHMVFKFNGKDVSGKTMDPTANEFDGYAQSPF